MDVALSLLLLLLAGTTLARAEAVISTTPTEAGQPFALLVSDAADRSAAYALEGAVVRGKIHVFVVAEGDISEVQFWFDDPAMSEAPHRQERSAPWDFNGGQALAYPFDTTAIPEGPHSITAAIHRSDGEVQVLTGRFSVANDEARLVFVPAALSFIRQEGDREKITVPADLVTNILEPTVPDIQPDAGWLEGRVAGTTTPAKIEIVIDPAGLAAGIYRSEIRASAGDLGSDTLAVTLIIQESFAKHQVHLSWASDPAGALTVMWRTPGMIESATVEYRGPGDKAWHRASGKSISLPENGGLLHEVAIDGLRAATRYEYRVQVAGESFSDVFETVTAPASGPADVDVVFVADMALIGRLDGLDTGAEAVLASIRDIGPDLVLLGGDYVSFSSDQRFGGLEATIDAFFEQMAGLASSVPLMPTYGNHEMYLGEGYQPWSRRFATPSGFDGGKSFSFDVADAHFVSILAAGDDGLSQAALDWIDRDLAAAKARGQRWLIPYFHVPVFSDGANHGSNIALRRQLGPIFEDHGVQLVLTAHDQSFERTFPLKHVAAEIAPTSLDLGCYESTDGVVYMKVSPGGKLSNITGGFSPFVTRPPPRWTAIRDDGAHHFTHLAFSATGHLTVNTLGIENLQTEPDLIDSFELRDSGCGRLP